MSANFLQDRKRRFSGSVNVDAPSRFDHQAEKQNKNAWYTSFHTGSEIVGHCRLLGRAAFETILGAIAICWPPT